MKPNDSIRWRGDVKPRSTGRKGGPDQGFVRGDASRSTANGKIRMIVREWTNDVGDDRSRGESQAEMKIRPRGMN